MTKRSQTYVTQGTIGSDEDLPSPGTTTTRLTRYRPEGATPSTAVLATRVVYYLFSIVSVILAFRFGLALFGVSRANSFADFVFSISWPLVEPFFGLFGYRPAYGTSKFELYTLLAMAIYAVIAWWLVSFARLLYSDERA